MIDRVRLIRSLVNQHGRGLEVGPSHAPLFPKKDGFNVEIVDHADADDLRRKYANMAVDTDAIEEVDYVSDGRPLHDVVGRDGYFDFVFSSHAIEHVTDFIGYLKSCERLLVPGGRAVLAIPDKRFIFDAIHPVTTIGEVLEAHERASARHAPRRVFDFASGVVSLGPLNTWNAAAAGDVRLERSLAQAREWFDRALSGEYVDVHAWRFTPASFRLLIRDLCDLEIIGLKIERLESEDEMEFFVSLSREAEAPVGSRIDFVKDVHREQIRSSMQLLGDEDLGGGKLLPTNAKAPATIGHVRSKGWLRRLFS